MKKMRLNPKAKRDFSVLNEQEKERVGKWLKDKARLSICPFPYWFDSCDKCHAVFPEINMVKTGPPHCPCTLLYVKDVIKIAREVINA